MWTGEPWFPAVEPSDRWVRVRLGDTLVAESKQPLLLIQYGPPPMLPTYYFSPDEVDTDLLVEPREQADGSKTWSVVSDGHEAADAAWTHPNPKDALAPLENRITFDWFGQLKWFEEDELLFAHARDPHKRVDVAPSSRHVVVQIDGVQLADSERPLLLFETLLPTRFYLPKEDVRMELLTPTAFTSLCPYKGEATYWSASVEGEVHENIAWSYPDPIPENPRLKDLVCFFNERVELTVDGVIQDRPQTPWS